MEVWYQHDTAAGGRSQKYASRVCPTKCEPQLSGTTALLSISGSANKLTAQVIFPNKNKVAMSTPTRESSRVPPEVALPDLLLSVAHSPKGWNYHVLYKEEYRKDVLRPYQSAVFEDRFRRGGSDHCSGCLAFR